MDQNEFDRVTIAAASGSRRVVWRAVTGLVLGGALGFGRRAERADAARARCKGNYSEREVKRIIRRAARKYKISYKQMLCVAKCESVLDPCARNPDGPWYGLFQFLKSTFEDTPYGDKNIYHPKWNAFAAGWLWKRTPKKDLGSVWTCYKIANCGK